MSTFKEELIRRLQTPRDEYLDDLPNAEEIIAEAQKGPFRVGSLDGVIPPPPPEFWEPMTEEELRDWEGRD